MAIVGGLRSRLILYSLFNVIEASLTQLGWFDPGRIHKPIHLVMEEQDITTEVPINTLALSDEVVMSRPWEIGSAMTEDTHYYYVDFFGENDAVAKDIIGDIRDILLGHIGSIGRTSANLDVYDLTQATPPHIFSCPIEQVRIDRSHEYSQTWLRHWYSIQFTVCDYISSDQFGTFGFGTFGFGTFGGI